MADPLDHLHIVGPGRAGMALGRALAKTGAVRRITVSGRSASPPAHPLFDGTPPAAGYQRGLLPSDSAHLSALIIAVPDGSIAAVSSDLAAADPLPRAVLHLSGAFGSELLTPLADRGVSTGSLHPLVALADPAASERLQGAWFALEATGAANEIAERLVEALEGRILHVTRAGKPLYHAAAAAASNFVVAILGEAERWMTLAGVAPVESRPALAWLAAGAIDSVARRGPVEALTGPVARGDTATVRAHLAQLSSADRHLYSVLAISALALARERGLAPDAMAELAHLLETTE